MCKSDNSLLTSSALFFNMTFNPTEIALVKLQRQSKDDEIFVFIATSHEYLCNKLMYKQNNLNLSDVFYRM